MTSLLLTDSTMPVSFSKAGVRSAHAMARHLGDRVHMVSDVHIELQRLSQRLPALAKLLRGWPLNPVRELDLHLKGEVAAAIKARQFRGSILTRIGERSPPSSMLLADERRGRASKSSRTTAMEIACGR